MQAGPAAIYVCRKRKANTNTKAKDEILNRVQNDSIKDEIPLRIKLRGTGPGSGPGMIDLTVPGGMGGKETNERLLEIDPDVRTIVSSGYFNDPVMSQYNKCGFKGVITKPYTIEELSKTIHSVLNGER